MDTSGVAGGSNGAGGFGQGTVGAAGTAGTVGTAGAGLQEPLHQRRAAAHDNSSIYDDGYNEFGDEDSRDGFASSSGAGGSGGGGGGGDAMEEEGAGNAASTKQESVKGEGEEDDAPFDFEDDDLL